MTRTLADLASPAGSDPTMIERIELEWAYEPPGLFEDPLALEGNGYSLVATEGRATATLPPEGDDPENFLRITKEVRARVLMAGVHARKVATLSNHPNIIRIGEDGGRNIAVTVRDGVVLSEGHPPDVVITDSDGNVVADSRVDRITDRITLADAAARHCEDATAAQLVESAQAAVGDPEDELVHLWEIPETLERHFGSRLRAADTLGIPRSHWTRLSELCNNRSQGRHRGAKDPEMLEPATPAELDEARDLAEDLIRAYLSHLDRA